MITEKALKSILRAVCRFASHSLKIVTRVEAGSYGWVLGDIPRVYGRGAWVIAHPPAVTELNCPLAYASRDRCPRSDLRDRL